jgi:hypothetical protein
MIVMNRMVMKRMVMNSGTTGLVAAKQCPPTVGAIWSRCEGV